jgi:membrane protease YdiL (CAAX protease family)
MKQSTSQSDWRLAHGVAFILFMGCAFAVPALRRWPWVWLVPFVGYFALIGSVPPLRRSMNWLHAGALSSASVAVTIVIMVLTVSALILFNVTVRPDLRDYRAALPFGALGGVVMAGVIFTLVNATLEELVFRGVLFDALQSQWGSWVTLTTTALLFGLGHLRGYPSGFLGSCMAVLFGFAMGVLRLWTGGLALPIVAHMAADATIYGILVHSGAA